jgi:glycosyltransferase involved in cell wall biosynthesis
MKIAFLATKLTKYDAISNYSVDVLKKLSNKHQVDLYTFVTQTEIPAKIIQYNYTDIKDHTLKSVILSFTKVSSLTKKLSKYDLLILCGPDLPILLCAHMARHFNSNLKIIWDFHGLTPLKYLYFKDKILNSFRLLGFIQSMKQSDLILVRSEYIKRELEPYVKPEMIKVVSFGINLNPFKNVDPSEIRLKHNLNNHFVLLYVGRLVPSKQVDFLIKALPNLSEDFTLVIVGGGIEKENLENLAASLNVRDRVIFAGRVSDEDLPKYYASSNAFVTASLHEGFCVPIIESFASDKPAVVPDRTAMPEVVADGGLIYDGSIEDLSLKLKSLKDPEVLETINIRVTQIIKKYDIINVSEEYLKTIEKVMDRSK